MLASWSARRPGGARPCRHPAPPRCRHPLHRTARPRAQRRLRRTEPARHQCRCAARRDGHAGAGGGDAGLRRPTRQHDRDHGGRPRAGTCARARHRGAGPSAQRRRVPHRGSRAAPGCGWRRGNCSRSPAIRRPCRSSRAAPTPCATRAWRRNRSASASERGDATALRGFARGPHRPARRVVQPRPCGAPACGADGAPRAAARPGVAHGLARQSAEAGAGHGAAGAAAGLRPAHRRWPAHHRDRHRACARHALHRRYAAGTAPALSVRAIRPGDRRGQPGATAAMEGLAPA